MSAVQDVEGFAQEHGLSAEAVSELQGLLDVAVATSTKSISIRVPATVGNLGPGLDCTGLALDIWDEYKIEYAEEFHIEVKGEGAGSVPRDKTNHVVIGAECAFRAAGKALPQLRFRCDCKIPVRMGLGNESAAFIAGYIGASRLTAMEAKNSGGEESSKVQTNGLGSSDQPSDENLPKLPRTNSDITSYCLDPDAASRARGTSMTEAVVQSPVTSKLLNAAVGRGWSPGHIAPGVFGGLQVSWKVSSDACQNHRVPVPSGLICVVFCPNSNDDGGWAWSAERASSPCRDKDEDSVSQSSGSAAPNGAAAQKVGRQDAIFNVGRVGLLINCFVSGDFDLLHQAMEDRLHQGSTSARFPHVQPVLEAAKEAGSAGVCVSGQGPAVVAFLSSRSGDILAQSMADQKEHKVATAMLQEAERAGVPGRILITKPVDFGAHIVAARSDLACDANAQIQYFQ